MRYDNAARQGMAYKWCLLVFVDVASQWEDPGLGAMHKTYGVIAFFKATLVM